MLFTSQSWENQALQINSKEFSCHWQPPLTQHLKFGLQATKYTTDQFKQSTSKQKRFVYVLKPTNEFPCTLAIKLIVCNLRMHW